MGYKDGKTEFKQYVVDLNADCKCGCMEGDRFHEIYRFPNGTTLKNGHQCWDHEGLFNHIVAGLKKAKEIGKVPSYLGIDTWGVDFLLLDKDGKVIGDSVGYRDKRTEGIDAKVYEILPEAELYARTGIQKQLYNTVYQLMAL